MRPQVLTLFAGLALSFCTASLLAEDSCRIPELADQQKDAATVEKLENAFAAAFLRGDTDFEKCLLLSNYAEVSRSGKWRELSEELQGTAKNRGKNMTLPGMPKIDVLMHGDVAIAHGQFTFTEPDGKTESTRFSDVYVWTDNTWHVLFSQQTPTEGN